MKKFIDLQELNSNSNAKLEVENLIELIKNNNSDKNPNINVYHKEYFNNIAKDLDIEKKCMLMNHYNLSKFVLYINYINNLNRKY